MIWSWTPCLFSWSWIWTSWILFSWLWPWIRSWLCPLWIWSWTPCLFSWSWIWTSWILFLAMAMDTVLAMPIMDMESVMLTLCQRLMLSMEPMLDMVTDLDIVHTPLDTVLDMVMDMDMDTDMDTMVELYIVKSA